MYSPITLIALLVLRDTSKKFTTINIREFTRKYHIDKINLKGFLEEFQDCILKLDNTIEVHRICLLTKLLEKGVPMEMIIHYSEWSDFEELASEIFKSLGYYVFKNVRFSYCGKRWEIDIVSVKDDLAIIVDCKRWKRVNGSRLSILYNVAENHLERTRNFVKVLEEVLKHPIVTTVSYVIPLIVVFYDQDLLLTPNKIPIIPISFLKEFLKNLDYYKEFLKFLLLKRKNKQKRFH